MFTPLDLGLARRFGRLGTCVSTRCRSDESVQGIGITSTDEDLGAGVQLALPTTEQDVSALPFVPPPPGITVDQAFDVTPAQSWAAPCILVTERDFTVFVPKAELEALAVTPLGGAWNTERERQALQLHLQAKSLLDATAKQKDAEGCFSTVAGLGSDARLQVFQDICRGRAAVLDCRSGQLLHSVKVRYKALRAGPMMGFGDISVAAPDGSWPFLILSWWRS